jgi:hypothetical protein
MRDMTKKLLILITFSQERDLDSKTEEDRFKWFLASSFILLVAVAS